MRRQASSASLFMATITACCSLLGGSTALASPTPSCQSYNASWDVCTLSNVHIRDGGVQDTGSQWIPPRVRGDSEFNGCSQGEPHWNVSISALPCQQDASGNYHAVCLDWGMEAYEQNGDHTRAAGNAGDVLYSAPMGKQIWASVNTSNGNVATFSKAGVEDRGGAWCYNAQVYTWATGPLVKRLEVYGDRSGSDAGVFTGMSVDLNSIVFYRSR